MHPACVRSVHDDIIHAWSMCLCNDLQCAACMCVWFAFTWHIGMPEGFIVLVPYFVAKLSFHIECKISLNYIVHNVKSGKFYQI